MKQTAALNYYYYYYYDAIYRCYNNIKLYIKIKQEYFTQT